MRDTYRAYTKWNKSDDQALRGQFDLGYDIAAMAKLQNRSAKAILERLKKLKLVVRAGNNYKCSAGGNWKAAN